MKIIYSIAMSCMISGYAFAADISQRLNFIEEFKKEISRPHAILGSGYYYPSSPDSEEKIALKMIMNQKWRDLRKFRADSPYPEEVEVIQPDGTVLLQEKEQQPSNLSLKDRKDSVASYGSLSTISVETPVCVDTPVAEDDEGVSH